VISCDIQTQTHASYRMWDKGKDQTPHNRGGGHTKGIKFLEPVGVHQLLKKDFASRGYSFRMPLEIYQAVFYAYLFYATLSLPIYTTS